MKKKFKQTLQKPIVISLLCLLMIVALAVALTSLQGLKGTNQRSSTLPKEIRNGTQVASVSIKDPNAASGTQEASTTNGSTSAASMTPSDDGSQSMTSGEAAPAGDRVKFKISTFQKLALQPLKFQIFDEQASELTPEFLRSIQGEKVHFFLVHANLREFQHLIPSYGNGTWNISANMPTPGTYYAYTVFSPIRGKQTGLRTDLVVRTPSPADITMPDPSAGLTASEGSNKVTMSMQRTDAGRILSFTLTQGDKSAAVEPVFESLGQVTLLKHKNPASFMTVTADPFSNEGQGLISFLTGSLSPGRYTSFAEFRLGGKVYIFPLTFDVGA